ncbi:MAG: DUF4430 domain-containing protein [Oscillospiraceae bacterium]|nr:DUF4430 domain-containing protein [Oscillospiraceae bacterium]
MKAIIMKHLLSVLLCAALTVFAAFALSGCSGAQTLTETTQGGSEASVSDASGEDSVSFTFIVTGEDGGQTVFDIQTDKDTVGEALLERGLISGEEGPYGLYVTEVNGLTADYEKDGFYWAFYIDGEYASAGVDATEAAEGAVYEFRMEAA